MIKMPTDRWAFSLTLLKICDTVNPSYHQVIAK